MSEPDIRVEVAYALPHKQSLIDLTMPAGSTIEDAITVSKVCDIYPQIDLTQSKVGVWNRAAKLSTVLGDGDRVEIYRPLIADPKEVRKRRAAKAIEEGRADKVTGGRPKS
jgi:putative ubiquitin-RnfH superfamily antitoxin RatB of RatAB toxin-antitoxin module